jgi:hypothetical protein
MHETRMATARLHESCSAYTMFPSKRTPGYQKARAICLAAAAGAAAAVAISADRTAEGIVHAGFLGTAMGALFGWSLVTSDPMESDAPQRSYVGVQSPDDPALAYNPEEDSAARRAER